MAAFAGNRGRSFARFIQSLKRLFLGTRSAENSSRIIVACVNTDRWREAFFFWGSSLCHLIIVVEYHSSLRLSRDMVVWGDKVMKSDHDQRIMRPLLNIFSGGCQKYSLLPIFFAILAMDFRKDRINCRKVTHIFTFVSTFFLRIYRRGYFSRDRWYDKGEDFADVASFMEPEATRRKRSARTFLKES